MAGNSGSNVKPTVNFTGLRVCSFESRKGAEMRSLIERHGGVATIAPSMQEIPIGDNPEALQFAAELFAGDIDLVVFMTGVGARALADAVATKYDRDEFFEKLRQTPCAVRGPKPVAVLREWKVPFEFLAPEPNTWRELLAVLSEDLSGQTVAVQEYGRPNAEFYAELQRRGATVRPVTVYRWALPDDTGPLVDAIRTTIDGGFDVLMFTSAHQLDNVLEVADSLGLKEAWTAAANRCIVASIGPTASETLCAADLPVDLEPEHPKMGHLVRAAAQSAARLLAEKRSN